MKAKARVPAAFRRLLRRGLAQAGLPLQAGPPHPVYVLGLDRPRLSAAAKTGWRSLLPRRGKGPQKTAEVAVDARGRATVFSHLSHGPAAAGTARFAGARAGVAALTLFGYLRVPALSLGALWLRDARGADWLWPLRPLPPGWEGRRYLRAEFEQVLSAAAARQLELHETLAARAVVKRR